MRISASDALIEIILENKVDTVFGYPGGAVVPLYDSLHKNTGRIKHIRTAHEQGAVFAADGYARVSGRPGVCIATSGPGATNLITGIAGAHMDSIPMVVITGQAPSALLGRDSFQEIDITAMTLPITKHNYSLTDASRFVQTVREAFEIASSGRPGPVHIDIPRDVFLEIVDYEQRAVEEKSMISEIHPDTIRQIEEAAIEIGRSKKPVIYAGGGVTRSKAFEELLEFAQKCDIPVANTLMGLSSFPSSHCLSLGLCGMHGHRVANMAIAESDLIIAVGARFSDRSVCKGDALGKTVIQIDIDETEMGKNVQNTMPIRGDIKTLLPRLTDISKEMDRSSWIEEARSRENEIKSMHSGINFNAKGIISRINGKFANAVVATDVGQHQMWTAQHWKFEAKGGFLSSGGLGAMGYGLGAAIGGKAAGAERVVLITGDGSFKMNFNELATMNAYDIPITVVVLNNSALGMVRQLQKVFTQERYSAVDVCDNTDYCTLARAFGISSFRAKSYGELEDVLSRVDGSKSAVIECVTEKEMNVEPMVRPGGGIWDMIYV
ncbi:acetolactate synthase, large subunit, partial [Peptoclostridium litorale DSM 5388]|uniref:Acetolactate synthase n=2 Tax=Peptoclostridium litorale TaxID=1557 RepID=A0A069RBT1_PEPLI